MHSNRSVDVHRFAMVPRADIPRSSFRMESAHKTTFNSGYLIPVFRTEVLPGDTFAMSQTMFARLATPLFPLMDNMYMDWQWFFIPYRLLWDNFVKMMGEQENPGDSIAFTVPQQVCPAGGYAIGSLQDYLGLPTVGQVAGGATVSHSALPVRAYNLVYNQWYRDQNLQNSVTVDKGNGPDTTSNYQLLRRGKRHDYFTACLPSPQKGNSVSIPLGTQAPVRGAFYTMNGGGVDINTLNSTAANVVPQWSGAPGTTDVRYSVGGPPGLYADLTTATAATINQLRQSFQVQKLLERDARSGTRYTEKIQGHFGVRSPDMRLQRAEFLGGGSSRVIINPVAQTSATSVTGSTTPLGNLSAMGTALGSGGFTHSFTEHGIIMCLVSVRADLTYQQGLERFWSRLTQYDFFWPVFSGLGEQTVLNKEIYVRGDANDALAFGYQERAAEYRYHPSRVSGLFRSTAAGTLDAWHLAQKFTTLPALNSTFIQDTPPVNRVIATPSQPEFIFDSIFSCRAARPMPMYSVPGLIDHF